MVLNINERPININISTKTIIKIIVVFLLLYFAYLIRDILIILFISLVLASAFDPWVDWLNKRKIPRSLGILLIYFILLAVISAAVYLIIPPIAQQVGDLANNFPGYLEKIISTFSSFKQYSVEQGLLDNIKNSLGGLSTNLEKAASSVFTTVTGIFGGIFSFFLILVLTFYMTVEESAMKKLVWSIAPAKHQPYLLQLINRMQNKMGLWLRGQLIVSLAVAVLVYVGLTILGVKYALVLALIAGITEFIPYLGPIIGAIPGVFLAFGQSPTLALFTIIIYIIVQLVENNILVPKIMQKTVGLNPIVSIVALMIGFQLAGIIGAIMSIPVTTALSVFVKDMFDSKTSSTKMVDEE